MRKQKKYFVLITFLLFALMALTLFSCDMLSPPKSSNSGNTIKITITTTGLSAYREYWIGVYVKSPNYAVSTSSTRRDSNGTHTLTLNARDIHSEAIRRLWEGEAFYIMLDDQTAKLRRFSLTTYTINNARTFTLDLDTHFGKTWQSNFP